MIYHITSRAEWEAADRVSGSVSHGGDSSRSVEVR